MYGFLYIRLCVCPSACNISAHTDFHEILPARTFLEDIYDNISLISSLNEIICSDISRRENQNNTYYI